MKKLLYVLFFLQLVFSTPLFDFEQGGEKSTSCTRRKTEDGSILKNCTRIRMRTGFLTRQRLSFQLNHRRFTLKKPKLKLLDRLSNYFDVDIDNFETQKIAYVITDSGITFNIQADGGYWNFEPCSSEEGIPRCHILSFISTVGFVELEPPNAHTSRRRRLTPRNYTGDYLCSLGKLSDDRNYCCPSTCAVCDTSITCSGPTCCGVSLRVPCSDFNAPCDMRTTAQVSVGYTPWLIAGTTLEQITIRVNLAVSEANAGYLNSKIPIFLVLKELYLASDVVTYDNNQDLNLLTEFRDAASTKSRIGTADFQVLVYRSGAACGIASFVDCVHPSCTCIVRNSGCLVGYFSFAHEIGHLQGASHNSETGHGAAERFPYAKGKIIVPGQSRTIMSYNLAGETRVNVWSSPQILWGGVVTGTPTLDNARALIATRYEHSILSPTSMPTVSPSRVPTKSPFMFK